MDIYAEITSRIISEMETGIIPWQKPWVSCGKAISHATGKPYSLLNQMLLGRPGEYLTFKQCQQAGGYVRKGEKAQMVVFWKFIEQKDEETGETKEVPFLRYEAGRDTALVLRDVVDGSYYTYRIFHAGMATPVPIANGGTGASSAANARANIGANNASNLTTGTVPAARLPFKVAYGSTSISCSSSVTINYSSAGFTSVPKVLVTYSTTSSNWSGDNGAIKVHSKTTTQASIVVGGSFNTSRNVDWLAIGT